MPHDVICFERLHTVNNFHITQPSNTLNCSILGAKWFTENISHLKSLGLMCRLRLLFASCLLPETWIESGIMPVSASEITQVFATKSSSAETCWENFHCWPPFLPLGNKVGSTAVKKNRESAGMRFNKTLADFNSTCCFLWAGPRIQRDAMFHHDDRHLDGMMM